MASRTPRATPGASKLPEPPKPPKYLSLSRVQKQFELMPLLLGVAMTKELTVAGKKMTVLDFKEMYETDGPAVLLGPTSAQDRSVYLERTGRNMEADIRKIALTVNVVAGIENALMLRESFLAKRAQELKEEDPKRSDTEVAIIAAEDFRNNHLDAELALNMALPESGAYNVPGYDHPVHLLDEMTNMLSFLATRYGVIRDVDYDLYIKNSNDVRAYDLASVDEVWFKSASYFNLPDLLVGKEGPDGKVTNLWETIFKVANLFDYNVEEARVSEAEAEDKDEQTPKGGEGPVPFS